MSINAVNTIKINRKGDKITTEGYNTDVFGFEQSLSSVLPLHSRALVLGSGGGSAAVRFVLDKFGISYKIVSRKPADNRMIAYDDLDAITIINHTLIINTTPLGMYPEQYDCPAIPFENLSNKHFLYDLIYNPAETLFLKRGREKGAGTKNGMDMLIAQGEKSWEIWNR